MKTCDNCERLKYALEYSHLYGNQIIAESIYYIRRCVNEVIDLDACRTQIFIRFCTLFSLNFGSRVNQIVFV